MSTLIHEYINTLHYTIELPSQHGNKGERKHDVYADRTTKKHTNISRLSCQSTMLLHKAEFRGKHSHIHIHININKYYTHKVTNLHTVNLQKNLVALQFSNLQRKYLSP